MIAEVPVRGASFEEELWGLCQPTEEKAEEPAYSGARTAWFSAGQPQGGPPVTFPPCTPSAKGEWWVGSVMRAPVAGERLLSFSSLDAVQLSPGVAVPFLPSDAEAREAVLLFLRQNPDLQPVIVSMREKLEAHFKNRLITSPVLEVVENPEEPDDRILVLFATMQLSISEGLRTFETFCREWWFRQQAFREGKLDVHVGFSEV